MALQSSPTLLISVLVVACFTVVVLIILAIFLGARRKEQLRKVKLQQMSSVHPYTLQLSQLPTLDVASGPSRTRGDSLSSAKVDLFDSEVPERLEVDEKALDTRGLPKYPSKAVLRSGGSQLQGQDLSHTGTHDLAAYNFATDGRSARSPSPRGSIASFTSTLVEVPRSRPHSLTIEALQVQKKLSTHPGYTSLFGRRSTILPI